MCGGACGGLCTSGGAGEESISRSFSTHFVIPQVPIQVCTVVDTEREPIVSTVVGTEYKTGKKGKPKPSKLFSIIHKSKPFYGDVVYTLFNQNYVALTLSSLIVGMF